MVPDRRPAACRRWSNSQRPAERPRPAKDSQPVTIPYAARNTFGTAPPSFPPMKTVPTVLASIIAIGAGAFLVAAVAGNRAFARENGNAAVRLERGRYLVNQVVLCVDCHTPHDERGQPVTDKQLQGAPVPFAPLIPMPWAGAAPRLAGLPGGYSADDLIKFLMTGERPNGLPPPRPPMPPYRLNRDDAEAVTAYIQSLPSGLP